jgi:hypothetical protein
MRGMRYDGPIMRTAVFGSCAAAILFFLGGGAHGEAPQAHVAQPSLAQDESVACDEAVVADQVDMGESLRVPEPKVSLVCGLAAMAFLVLRRRGY